MRIALVALCLSTQLVSGVALAQTQAEMAACKADYEKFCSGVAQGGGRILKCLNQHMSALTPDCQKVVKENTPG